MNTPTAPDSESPVVRVALLSAQLPAPFAIERIEVKRVTLRPHQASGLHSHPCAVVGVVTAGAVYFQVAEGPGRSLKAGDVFFEPPHAEVPHFDATEQGAEFVAYYLLPPGEHSLITML